MAFLASLRNATTYFRLVALPEAESIMNFSRLGSLQCHCEPTDAAEPRNDRRRSCRACGNAILPAEPLQLYWPLSKREIGRVVRRLRRAGIDARTANLATELTDLSALHLVESLADLIG